MHILFDSRNTQFKSPFGCLPLGDTLEITLYIRDAGESGVLFLLGEDGKEETAFSMTLKGEDKGYRVYTCTPPVLNTGLYYYRFSVETPCGSVGVYRDKKNNPVTEGNWRWQLTCYHNEYPIPADFCGAVMYQVFPDRFYALGKADTTDKITPFWVHENTDDLPVFLPDSEGIIQNNDFFGGNLKGIMAKLPYLKELGVTVLYLNPIFMAYSNHRYDTADYKRIDPLLGTEEDFTALCRSAHSLGMKIMLDGVFSHTGSDSVYFDKHNRFGGGAYHNENSPYKSWFQFEEYPHKYASWWGIKTLPCTNENDPAFRQYILFDEDSVIRHWLRLGADAWRLDVADELPEDFIYALHQTVKEENKEALVLGEVWEDASNKISYSVRRKYFQGKSLDAVMNYVWRDAIIRFVRGDMTSEDFHHTVMTLCEHYPKDSLNATMNLLSTHDTPRILTALGIEYVPESREDRSKYRLNEKQYELGKNRLFVAAFLLFCLPGSPCIYYGDEIGMEGFEDPFNRAYMGDRGGDQNIRQFYKDLAGMKNREKALRFGSLKPDFFENGVFAFLREEGCEEVFCIVNLSSTPKTVARKGTTLFARNIVEHEGEITLLPYGVLAIKTNK